MKVIIVVMTLAVIAHVQSQAPLYFPQHEHLERVDSCNPMTLSCTKLGRSGNRRYNSEVPRYTENLEAIEHSEYWIKNYITSSKHQVQEPETHPLTQFLTIMSAIIELIEQVAINGPAAYLQIYADTVVKAITNVPRNPVQATGRLWAHMDYFNKQIAHLKTSIKNIQKTNCAEMNSDDCDMIIHDELNLKFDPALALETRLLTAAAKQANAFMQLKDVIVDVTNNSLAEKYLAEGADMLEPLIMSGLRTRNLLAAIAHVQSQVPLYFPQHEHLERVDSCNPMTLSCTKLGRSGNRRYNSEVPRYTENLEAIEHSEYWIKNYITSSKHQVQEPETHPLTQFLTIMSAIIELIEQVAINGPAAYLQIYADTVVKAITNVPRNPVQATGKLWAHIDYFNKQIAHIKTSIKNIQKTKCAEMNSDGCDMTIHDELNLKFDPALPLETGLLTAAAKQANAFMRLKDVIVDVTNNSLAEKYLAEGADMLEPLIMSGLRTRNLLAAIAAIQQYTRSKQYNQNDNDENRLMQLEAMTRILSNRNPYKVNAVRQMQQNKLPNRETQLNGDLNGHFNALERYMQHLPNEEAMWLNKLIHEHRVTGVPVAIADRLTRLYKSNESNNAELQMPLNPTAILEMRKSNGAQEFQRI